MPPPPVDGGPVEDVEEEEEDGEDTEEDQVRAREPVRPDHQTVKQFWDEYSIPFYLNWEYILYLFIYSYFWFVFCLFCEKISS